MTSKAFCGVAAACMMLMAAGYLLFLASSWNQYQVDRANHVSRIDELLSRLPKVPHDDSTLPDA